MAYHGKHSSPSGEASEYDLPPEEEQTGPVGNGEEEEELSDTRQELVARRVVEGIAILVCLAMVFLLGRHFLWKGRSASLNESLQQKAVSVAPVDDPVGLGKAVTQAEKKSSCPISVDFEALRAENPDIIAWLYLEDTVLNYPILWRMDDNAYYLTHLASQEVNEYGSIFADGRSSFPFHDWNTLVYGHNMKDDTMFGIMDLYRTQDFYDEHKTMYLLTPEENFRVDVCCCFAVSVDSAIFEFPCTEKSIESTIRDITTRSDIRCDVTPSPDDRLISFSTCWDPDDYRLVVVGVLRPLDGEEK